MNTVRKFIRETVVTLKESPEDPSSDRAINVAREVTNTLDQLANTDNKNIDALQSLLRTNRDSIIADVKESHQRLGSGDYGGDEIELDKRARAEIMILLEKDSKMSDVKYPWRTALWISAYDAGTWDTLSYLTHVTDGSVSLLGSYIGTPIKNIEKAALEAGKDFLETASTGTLAGTAGAVAAGVFAAFNWKLHSRFASWLVEVSDDLPYKEAYDAFATTTMKQTVDDAASWSALFDSIISETDPVPSKDWISKRLVGGWLAFKGAWKGYTFADYKATLQAATRSFGKVLANPDNLYKIPIYDGPPGPATRKLLGYISVKKTVLTFLPGDLKPFEYIKSATQKLLSNSYVGTAHQEGKVAAAIDTLMQGQLADSAIDGGGAFKAVGDPTAATETGIANVLAEPMGRMMDAAESPEAFNSLMADRISAAIKEAQSAAPSADFSFKPAAGSLDITSLPDNFYADVSSVSEISALRTAVKEGKTSLKEFSKKCAIPLENITTLGNIFKVWRAVKSGAKGGALLLRYAMGAGIARAFINPMWNDNPEGLTVLQGAQYITDAKIRIDAVRAWDNIRATEGVTKVQDQLAIALGGYDPENASIKLIAADDLLRTLLATKCGGADEASAPELINKILGLYTEYKYYMEDPRAANLQSTEPEPIPETLMRARFGAQESALRSLLREIIRNSRS